MINDNERSKQLCIHIFYLSEVMTEIDDFQDKYHGDIHPLDSDGLTGCHCSVFLSLLFTHMPKPV